MTSPKASRISKRLPFFALALLCLFACGTLVYMFMEGWSFIDAAYMSMLVLTTIGFTEVHPLSPSGRSFTILYGFASFVFLASSISILSTTVLERWLSGDRRRKRMQQEIDTLKGHIIVCGAGKIGRHVADALHKNRRVFLVVDSEEFLGSLIQERKERGKTEVLTLAGDPSREETLTRANIKHAAGLITCMPEDSMNLFIALSARNLNPRVRISSYVINETNERKFQMVGTDEVVSGDALIGRRLATSVVNKNVAAFLDQTTNLNEADALIIGDVLVGEKSAIVGKTLRSSGIHHNTGMLVVGLRQDTTSEFRMNPDPDSVIQAGNLLIAFGTEANVKRMEKYVNG